MKGEVVGIIVSSLENNSSCYAVPIEAAEKIRNDFVRFGEARHGWIGVNQLSEAPEPAGGSRAQVTQVMQGTPAAQCGMKEGDVLLQLGQKKICEPEDVFDASFYITAGDMVPITVIRGGKQLTFSVQAELHPVSKNVPMLSDGTRVPTAADANRSIPLRLESDVQQTP
jgi:serine protease Do